MSSFFLPGGGRARYHNRCWVAVPFATKGLGSRGSFPVSRRESRPLKAHFERSAEKIPAFARMTRLLKGIRSLGSEK